MNNAAPTSSPHSHQGHSVSQLMLHVLLACVPGTAALVFFFGFGVLFNLVSLVLMALLSEAAVLRLRRRAVMPALRDLSATVTAVLLALALMIIGIGVAPSPLLAIASDNGHKVGAAMQPEVK